MKRLIDYEKARKAMSWCNKNGIKLWIHPLPNGVTIQISERGKVSQSPNFYKNQTIASDKIWELYLYLYKKHNT